MKISNPFISLCEITANTSYKPVCIYETEEGGQLFAFFQWENETTLKKAVFSQLPGDMQVGKAKFVNAEFQIKLTKSAKVFKRFKINQELVKNQEYKIVIDFNGSPIGNPAQPGNIILRPLP